MATLNVETIKLIGNGVLDAKHVAVLLQADLLEQEASVDALQMNRVCTILSDAQELLVKGGAKQKKKAIKEKKQKKIKKKKPSLALPIIGSDR